MTPRTEEELRAMLADWETPRWVYSCSPARAAPDLIRQLLDLMAENKRLSEQLRAFTELEAP